MKKTKTRKKFNLLKFLIIAMVIYIIGFLVYSFFTFPIKNIRVYNSTILSDQEILRISKIDDYPSFFLTSKSAIEKKLKNNDYIKDVIVRKKWLGVIEIEIIEKKILFFDIASNKLVLEGNHKVDPINQSYPVLSDSLPTEIYLKFEKKMELLEEDVLFKISEIKYVPNEVDEERFLFIMSDGNYVYLTLYTFDKVNKYNVIIESLEKKRGILYLDSGNYFKVLD
ncbi:MAG: FtsQ-type POTRA domain-containing protein [Mollicutes bacterium]|nr:FtsQ-type POTRA domain-containing protein [Mollicutes bacterium]